MRLKNLRLSTPAAIIAGAIIVAVAIPTASYAAATLTAISNSAGTQVAQVNQAKQLHVGPAAPRDYVEFAVSGFNGECQPAYTVPADRAFVLQAATFTITPATDGAPASGVILGDECTTFAAVAGTLHFGSQSQTFGAGITFSSGEQVSIFADDANILVLGYGYLVPAAAVPASPATATPMAPEAVG